MTRKTDGLAIMNRLYLIVYALVALLLVTWTPVLDAPLLAASEFVFSTLKQFTACLSIPKLVSAALPW